VSRRRRFDKCDCKDVETFIVREPRPKSTTEPHLWRCSQCKHVGPWAEGFQSYGPTECVWCQREPSIEAVYCAPCTAQVQMCARA
jgi:hypothetical protein